MSEFIKFVPLEQDAPEEIQTIKRYYNECTDSFLDIPARYNLISPYGLELVGGKLIFDAEARKIFFDGKYYSVSDGSALLQECEAPKRSYMPQEKFGKSIILGFHSRIYNNIGHFISDQLPILDYQDFLWKSGFRTIVVAHIRSDLLILRITQLVRQVAQYPFEIIFRSHSNSLEAECFFIPQNISRHPVAKSRSLKRLFHSIKLDDSCKKKRRIYVSRKDAQDRRVLNEDEVEKALEQLGFESICTTAVSPQEARDIFGACEIVVGPLGASLAHIVFCQPGTQVVVLNPFAFGGAWFHNLAELFELKFLQYSVDMREDQSPERKRFGSDYIIDIGKLTGFLRELGV